MPYHNISPETRRPVPWGLGYALAVFLIMSLVAPLVADGLVYPFHRFFPTFDEETAVTERDAKESSDNTELEGSSGVEETRRETENALSDSNDSAENAAVTVNEILNNENVGAAPAPNAQSFKEDSVFNPKNISTQHPLARLLIRSYFTPYFKIVVVLFFLSVVCLAPLTEEFVFRVTLQGATEKALDVMQAYPDPDAPTTPIQGLELTDEEKNNLDERISRSERVRKIRVVFAILAPALLFAALHAGVPEDPDNPQPLNDLFNSLVTTCVSSLLTIFFGVSLLVKKAGAKRMDFGLAPRLAWESVLAFACHWGEGVFLLAIGAPIVFGVNAICERLFPGAIVAPIPILIFAIYEGVVYYRSHRFATILGMHMALNFISFVTLMGLVLGG